MFGHMICVSLQTGLRCKKNRYLPDLECSTAFSMKSTIVLLLNFVKLPKLKLPVRKYALVKLDTNKTQTLDNFKILTLVVFYSDMANKPVEFEGEAARSTLKFSQV